MPLAGALGYSLLSRRPTSWSAVRRTWSVAARPGAPPRAVQLAADDRARTDRAPPPRRAEEHERAMVLPRRSAPPGHAHGRGVREAWRNPVDPVSVPIVSGPAFPAGAGPSTDRRATYPSDFGGTPPSSSPRTSDSLYLRCPPKVRIDVSLPAFAQRVTVLGSTRNIVATSAGVNSGSASVVWRVVMAHPLLPSRGNVRYVPPTEVHIAPLFRIDQITH